MSHKLIKRYRCTVSDSRGHNGDCMAPDIDGAYVEYTTHQNVVKDLERQITDLKAKLQAQGGK
ncbi:hypothetical protein [Vibrio phage LV6]|nr:hypothetical protein [Vibrio phage LV6]